jgi:hypothetical protein
MAASVCHAADQSDDVRQKFEIRLDYSAGAPDPMDAFTRAGAELRKRARREARDDTYEPVVNSDQLRDGQWRLISATTPRRGVFYWMPNGPYGGRGNALLEARNSLSVCRFTMSFAPASPERLVSDLSWAALPEPDCSEPAQPEIKRVVAWRGERGKARYKVLANVKAGNLHTWLIEQSNVRYPFDAIGAAVSILDPGDIVVGAASAGSYYRPVSYVTSRSGRVIVGFHDPSALTRSSPACIVEGLTWNDLLADARSPLPAMSSARKTCTDLVAGQRERQRRSSEQDLSTHPITTHPIPPEGS